MGAVTKLSIIRLFELVIVCILVGLHYHSTSWKSETNEMLTMGTIGGYLIILVGLFVAPLMGTAVNRRVDMFYSIVGVVLFTIVGGLNINHYRKLSQSEERDIGLAKGSLAIIEAIFFLADSIFSGRSTNNDL